MPKTLQLPLRWFFFALTISLMAVVISGCSGSEVEVLECSGECTCEEETRSCSCAGGTTCAIDGADDITFYCDGNAACDLTCGYGCHVVCPGTTGCTTTLGPDSSAECKGTASCTYYCEGDCDVECSGASSCTVECADDCEQDGTQCRC